MLIFAMHGLPERTSMVHFSITCIGDGRNFAASDRPLQRSASMNASSSIPRPGFAELLAFIEAGNAEVLMTWESSRASRDLSTFLPCARR
jgi:hypothetical protein